MIVEREFLMLAGVLLPLAALACSGPHGQKMQSVAPDACEQVRAAVDSIRLIDTHEHLISESLWLKQKVDFFYWFQQPWFPQYAGADLVAAGMTGSDLAALGDTSRSDEERWALVEPWWPFARHTAFCRALSLAARDLYGIEQIDSLSWRDLNDRMRQAQKPGFYDTVLRDRAGIDLMILDRIVLIDEDVERELPPRTVRVRRFDEDFIAFDRATVQKFADKHGRQVRGLDDWLGLLDLEFQEIMGKGFYVGLKNAQAYDRPLSFDEVPKERAERVFSTLMGKGALDFIDRKPLEDFMMHEIAGRAGKYGLPVQIHTGIQAGPGNDLGRSNPLLLLPLIQKHPDTRFVLFHGAFPYMAELGVLAKNYRNVFIDMCWMPVISPLESRQWLERWLETVPVNKIMVFGGDYLFPEGTYAHSRMARQVVAEALCGKVESGVLTAEEATWTASRLLRDNAIECFNLQRFL
jgi:uncharacterized protein